MGIAGLIAGTEVEVVGVEDDSDGRGLRIYLTHRSMGAYAVIEDADAQRQVREAWAGQGRVTVPTPPSQCVFWDEEP
jgi:hypothetical protein